MARATVKQPRSDETLEHPGPLDRSTVVSATLMLLLKQRRCGDSVPAVAMAHLAATAHLALVVHAELQAGESVYVAGGAGDVDGAAIILATRVGTRVIAAPGPAVSTVATPQAPPSTTATATWCSASPRRLPTGWTCTWTPPAASTWIRP
ncbi:hypothetical protein DQ238_01600 [Geodermatophilus sp. TF02-6]|nr:hypothetical protein DQ238_01600 [Geodermatophilus sp. TF02-6]